MTQVNKEEQANPYNAKKAWHDGKGKDFVSSDNVFFEEPEVSNDAEDVTKDEIIKETKPSKQKANYKKRYDDLKAHYDSKLEEFKVREAELLKEKPQYVAPKSTEDLDKFKKEYPDVYEVVETVAHMQSSEKTKDLEERLSALQQRENELIHRDAEKRLTDTHPDYDNIKNSDEFHSWAKAQPQSIQDWIYKNSSDADLASRALDLYKRDIGLDAPPKKTRSNSKRTQSNAADMVSTKTTAVEPKQRKIWSEREIAKMSIDEFDKFEEDITNAISEGRIAK